MTFATGQPKSKASCQRAFTLIELILVLTLLAIVTSVIAPSLGSFVRGRALDSEARRLLALTRAAQSRAVSEGMPMLFWMDTAQRAYGVEKEATAESGDPKAMSFSLDDNVQLEAADFASAAIKVRKLPAIRFLTDGTIEEGSLQTFRLRDSTGATLWLIETRNRMGYEIRTSDK